MTVRESDYWIGSHERYKQQVSRERAERDWKKSAQALAQAEEKAAAERLANETYEQFLIDGGWKK